jgi:hypothetical protein
MERRANVAWLVVSVVFHGVLLIVLVRTLEPVSMTDEPIPVKLVRVENPPEPEVAREFLHFRKSTHPRVRETLELPREILALQPPPSDVSLEPEAAPGGFTADLPPIQTLGGLSLPGAGGGSAGTGVGGGNASGAQGSFQEYVGGLRQVGLDVVFVLDATGSMGWLIQEVKDRVVSLSRWIRRLVPVTRFGVVAYRDDDDPEFLTRVQPLTLQVRKVWSFLDELQARGGGDYPEAVDAGLKTAIEKAGWKRDSRRVVILIGDAPPHPERLQETLELARRFHASGGTVTAVDVRFDANPTLAAARLGKRVEDLQTLGDGGVMPQFQWLAEAGGGDPSTLEGERQVVRRLAVLIFGERWAEDVRPLLGEL